MKTLNELNINIESLPEWANYIAMDRSGEWVVAEDPPFNHGLFEFRVKKEDKYIPFTFEDREVFRGKWIRNKATNSEFIITLIKKKKVDLLSYDQAFYKWEFLDGTPFGKLEGGSDE